MPKRAETPSKVQVAKKAKTEQPEAPVLAAIAAAELPKPCRDMLQAALPHCLSTPSAARHKFQLEVLDRIAGIFAIVEEKRRKELEDAEAKLASVQLDKDNASTDCENKKADATSKKGESDEKGRSVEEASQAVQIASDAVKVARQELEDSQARKQGLLQTKEDFQKFFDEMYHPLKVGTFGGSEWRKRNKVITEFSQKVNAIMTFEDSLLDAAEVVFKTKPDQREPFALATLDFVEKAFTIHTEKLAAELLSHDQEAESRKSAIEDAEAVVLEKKSQKQQAEQEWDAIQNVWVDSENTSAEAVRTLKDFEMKLTEAGKEVDIAKEVLEKIIAVAELLAKLKEPAEVETEAPMEKPEIVQTEQPEEMQLDAVHTELPEPLLVAAA
jgi:hypothetical protein